MGSCWLVVAAHLFQRGLSHAGDRFEVSLETFEFGIVKEVRERFYLFDFCDCLRGNLPTCELFTRFWGVGGGLDAGVGIRIEK